MRRFFLLLLLNVAITAIISTAVWIWLGKGFDHKTDYLNLDFFNTIGISFTIIGFIIAIYQIAELRNEQQIRNDTIDEFKMRYFKDDALYNFGRAKPQLEVLQRNVNSQIEFSSLIIYDYIAILNAVNHIIGNIQSQQENMHCETIIECGDLITLLEEIIADLHDVVNQRIYTNFPKQRFNSKIGKLILRVSKCEAKLKS